MKVQIKYEYSPNLDHPFIASTYIQNQYMVAVSDESFDKAKAKLLEKAKIYGDANIPEPEEVEI